MAPILLTCIHQEQSIGVSQETAESSDVIGNAGGGLVVGKPKPP